MTFRSSTKTEKHQTDAYSRVEVVDVNDVNKIAKRPKKKPDYEKLVELTKSIRGSLVDYVPKSDF